MKRYPKKLKLLLILVSSIVAGLTYTLVCFHLESQMTPWQRSQIIDFQSQRGTTKLKAHIDAATCAGAAFCLTAVTAIISYKITRRK